MPKYWPGEDTHCPISGPFDLWRKNYFRKNGELPEDLKKLWQALTKPYSKNTKEFSDYGIRAIAWSALDDWPLEQVLSRMEHLSKVEEEVVLARGEEIPNIEELLRERLEQTEMAYNYFSEWKKRVPFAPKVAQ